MTKYPLSRFWIVLSAVCILETKIYVYTVKLKLMALSVLPETRSCLADEYRCMYADVCIPMSSFCDEIKDCPDGTDEIITRPGLPTDYIPNFGVYGCGKKLRINNDKRTAIPSMLLNFSTFSFLLNFSFMK